jgi:hypothetical protein
VAGPDPTSFLRDAINEYLKDGKTGIYVRGDDMPNFPGRSLVEKHMPIQLVPYTQGVSSTLLRLKVISQSLSRDEAHPHVLLLVSISRTVYINIYSLIRCNKNIMRKNSMKPRDLYEIQSILNLVIFRSDEE